MSNENFNGWNNRNTRSEGIGGKELMQSQPPSHTQEGGEDVEMELNRILDHEPVYGRELSVAKILTLFSIKEDKGDAGNSLAEEEIERLKGLIEAAHETGHENCYRMNITQSWYQFCIENNLK